jgi:hypothetical protein
MNSETHFCLRVDVDTFEGLRKGIPEIHTLAKELDIPLTVYLSLGKYATGRNIFRKIKHKEKLTAIPPWRRNSIVSLTRGVILPPKRIGKSAQNMLKDYNNRDSIEIHPHGYNHVKWSSSFIQFTKEKTSEYINKMFSEYKIIFGSKPIANAAPNFQSNKYYFQIMKEKKVEFLADFKHHEPFYVQFETNNDLQNILQLPVTEPTLEDLLLQGKSIEKIKEKFKERFEQHIEKNTEYVCFYLHAIYEPFRLKKLLNYVLNLTIKLDMVATSHKNFKKRAINAPKIKYEKFMQR